MQDIIPPKNTQARGVIRPPVRAAEQPPVTRVTQSRETFRFSRAIDGVSGMVRTTTETTVSTTVLEPAAVQPPAPAAQPATVSTGIPQGSVRRQPIEPLESFTPVRPAINRSAPPADTPKEAGHASKHIDVTVIESPKRRWWKKSKAKGDKDFKRRALIVAAVIFVLITGYVSIDTWVTNSQATKQLETSTNNGEAGAMWTSEQEGQDETKVTAAALSKYAVAADSPRALYIDKLNISSRILPMSVNTAGSIQAPLNIYDAGWYTGSVKPGQTGAVFIDGHASGPTREGLFAYLDTLNEGDTLQVEKGDETLLTYKVLHKEVVALSDIDMKKVLLPYGNTLKGLNLMTCTGKWLESEKTYDHRVVVYTAQV